MDNRIVKKFFGTQEKLAANLEITQQTVSDWVRGKINPSIENARKMIELTNGAITYDDIYKKPATRQQAQ